MAVSTRFTKEGIRNHFTYSAWKYLLLVIGSIFIWDLIYTTTAYRPPDEKRVDVYVMSQTANGEMVEALCADIWQKSLPEMELVQSYLLTTDEYYGAMQLQTYIGAGEGDIYILPSATFKGLASSGAFLPLDEFMNNGTLNTMDLDLSAGRIALVNDDETLDEDGNSVITYSSEMYQFGIPLSMCEGLPYTMYMNGADMMLGITAFSGNSENAVTFINELLQDTRYISEEVQAQLDAAAAAPTAQPTEAVQ